MTAPVGPFDGNAEEWDRFVAAAAGWSHFHLYGWRDVIESVFGHECPYLARRDARGVLRGVLPLVRVKSRLFGHYLVSMPFLNYGAPLGDDESVALLADHAVDMATASRVKLLELRSRRQLPLSLPASHRKITVTLELPSGDPDPLWTSLPAKVRSQVRRPRKEGVTIRFGDSEIGAFHKVFGRHMRDLGTPALPRRFFEAVAQRFGEDVWFGSAYLDGRPIATGCGFHWADEFEMTWAAALREHNRVAPNMLLYWSFMERCVAEGVRVFNFGRCTPGGGTHRFKKQWGSRDEPLWWYQHGPGAGDGRGTPSPDQGAFSWGPRIWKHLPVSVANVMGPRVVRFIP